MPTHTHHADNVFLLSGQTVSISSVLMASQCKCPEGNGMEGRRKKIVGTPGDITKLSFTWATLYKNGQPDHLRY